MKTNRYDKKERVEMSEYGYIVKMKCRTNMHVGDGEENYSIIDKMVERDPVTGYPTVNASGVKGALKEFCKKKYADRTDDIDKIFGNEDVPNKSTRPGQVKILPAEMLARSARASEGKSPFYLVTTEYAVKRFNYWCGIVPGAENAKINEAAESVSQNELLAAEEIPLMEYYKCDRDRNTKRYKTKLYQMKEDDFRDLPLPVLARNCLDNGKSVNLWYEEVVPYNSIFYFAILGEQALVSALKEMIDNQIVQFGSGASIGYGLCELTILGGEENHE